MVSRLFRILVILAGIMGADGIILAAASAHQPDAARLAAASSMLLFHATAVLAVVALAERGVIDVRIGIAAAFGFVVAAALFAGDLTLRQICRPQPVSDGRADRRHAPDRELAIARGGGGLAAARLLKSRRTCFAPRPPIR
jgi:uncharacterized membrane protein YgdD (TMEM256/DUF423 family)